jgi:CRP-like cAMP-binding protein
LINEGDDADDFFVILSGAMEVLSTGESGSAPVKVRELGAGDYAGEIGLIERIPRTATVRATADSAVYRIEGQDFLDAVSSAPTMSSALSAGVAGRLARTHPSYKPRVREVQA